MSDKPAIPEEVKVNHGESKIQLLNLYDELSSFMHCNAFLNLAYLVSCIEQIACISKSENGQLLGAFTQS